ncbi:MAG: hypothetical protein HZA46_23890, partial [Planctomycetales bacterium]|nr:hypothetical protein [Planctomycetales bacterium]
MLEPLSDPLRSLLLELKLCSARDLRRCRGSVRTLTHDLPAFDSVWLDALVQIRRLTPFQARVLASAKPDRLRIGPCVLVDRLGGGPLGETFLARPIAGHDLCVVKRVNDRDGIGVSVDGVVRIEKLVAGLQDFAQPSCVGPHAVQRLLPSPPGRGAGGEGTLHCELTPNHQLTPPHPNPLPKGEGAMVLVSRFVPGPTLGELLVRRGRYPADVVLEVGRQLLDGLAALEQRGLAHGDIRLANVRLTDGGVAVLLDAGVRSALDPELTVHSGLAPDRYDGVAPELIGTGRPPNAASDLYA